MTTRTAPSRSPEEVKQIRKEMDKIDWWHSIDLGDGLITMGKEPGSRSRDAFLRIPDDLKGKKVMDVGTYDGLYAFEAESRGADFVMAVDHKAQRGFEFARKHLLSQVQFRIADIEWLYDDTRPMPGFDVVFCFGVIYHLQFGPMRGLWNIIRCMKPGGLLILETAMAEEPGRSLPSPALEFVERERDGDHTNWWYPNRPCMEAMLRSTGFREIEFTGGVGNRGTWHARKPE